MAKEVVKYNNQLNQISFSGSNITDNLLKLFFTIVAKIRNNGTEEVEISFDELKQLTADKTHYTNQEYKDLILKLYGILLRLTIKFDDGITFGEQHIFIGYESSLKDEVIRIKCTEAAQKLFNDIEYNFTRFELKEFVNLPGIYTKQLYRLLKQYRHLGNCSILIKDLRSFLDIPEKYQTREITRRIITPSINTLSKEIKEFEDLRFEYGYKGKFAIRVKFTWTPEKRYKYSAEKSNDMPWD